MTTGRRVCAALLGALACHPASARPTAEMRDASSAERARVEVLGKTGDVEAALAALQAANASEPSTRAQTLHLEVEWLANLGRCAAASEVAAIIERRSDATARQASRDARDECARLGRTPTGADLAAMRSRLREATRREATNPSKAAEVYLDAWKVTPTVAAMCGAARAAKAAGDGALATKSLERAAAFAARRQSVPPRIAALPPVDDISGDPRDVRVEAGHALFALSGRLADRAGPATNTMVISVDLATAAVTTLEAFPSRFAAVAVSARQVLVYDQTQDTAPRLLTLGVDDLDTAQPLEAGGDYVDHAAFTPDGTRVVVVLGHKLEVVVADASTGKTLATLGPFKTMIDIGGFARGGRELVLSHDEGAHFYDTSTWKPLPPDPNVTGYGVAVRGDWAAMNLPTSSGAYKGTIDVYDLAHGRVARQLHGNFQSVSKLVLAPDGRSLLTLSEHHTFAWDLATGAHTKLSEIVNAPFTNSQVAAFSDDSTHAVGYANDAVVVFSTATLMKDAASEGPIGGTMLTMLQPGHVIDVASGRSMTRVDLDARKVTSWDSPVRVDDLGASADRAWLVVTSSNGPGYRGPHDVVVYDANGALVGRISVPTYDAYRFVGDTLHVRTTTNEVVLDLETKQQTTVARSPAAPQEQGGLVSATSLRGDVVTLFDGGGGKVSLEGGTKLATVEIGRDFAVVTSTMATSAVIGDASHVRCAIGTAWLPLEACRAVSSPAVISDVLARWK